MDQLSAMRAFVRVVEAGTFTRAADLLDVPKPTVTKQIQQLEAHLRAKLLNRTTRRVTVTMDGAAYYERALRVLSEIDELDASMTLSQARPSGRLRVDVQRLAGDGGDHPGAAGLPCPLSRTSRSISASATGRSTCSARISIAPCAPARSPTRA